MCTMSLLLMTFLGRHGFNSWRTKMKFSAISRNSNPWSRTILKRRSRLYDNIMAEKSLQMNSKSYVKNRGLRGSWPLHIIHNRIGLQKGRIERSWKLQGKCFMINIFVTKRNSYGLGYHKRQLDSRNQSFPICKRNQISNTKGSKLVPYSGR